MCWAVGLALVDPLIRERSRCLIATRDVTVGQWLEEFLARKRKIEETTRRSYEGHIRLYLALYLGHIRLDRLKVGDWLGCSSRSRSSTRCGCQ
jgi:hypothetical protein